MQLLSGDGIDCVTSGLCVVGRAYVDARIQTISGGTTEIIEDLIGRDLGV